MRPSDTSKLANVDVISNQNTEQELLQPDQVRSAFPGDGEMSRLMGAFAWEKTPLGPIENWPQSLKTSVSICLASRFPIVLYWGPEYVVLYNDAYSQILGAKHPWALGKTCRECWAEIWETIGPMLDGVVKTGRATWSDDLLLMLERFGYREECYFSFSFSPVQVETGVVGGIFTAVIETTEKVIGERRLQTLRDLAAGAVAAKSEQDAWQIAANTLAENTRDVPFSILCQVANENFQLRGTAGISSTHPLCEELCTPGTQLFQRAMQVAKSGQSSELENLGAFNTDLPAGTWDTSPRTALLLPIAALGQGASGVLLVATSPAKAVDESYLTFFNLLARQIATSIADARSYEEERKRAEALAALDRAKTLFFSNISHELRTPLTLLLGPTESALSSKDGALKGADLEMVHRNELRLLKLVNTLLDFSRIEAGRVQALYEPLNLATLTTDIASAFRSAMEKAGLRFSVDCESIDEPVYVDREMWEKIVMNLLSNAFKFTFEGDVQLTLKLAESGIELTVRDTGIGIPADELPRIFERFHRVENARARTYEGTGIGLALVQELVKLHGGSVQAESVPGEGSAFHVLIPMGTAHLPADRIQAGRTQSSTALSAEIYVEEAERWLPGRSIGVASTAIAERGERADADAPMKQPDVVIVADDNADMREYLAHLLRDHYTVHAVSDGIEAIKAARQLRPSLVLADIMMPGMDGFGVLREIRGDESLKSTPVILLSARAGEESRLEGLHAGADDYLVKPFTARELIARVGTHLKMANLRREAAEREARLRAATELERRRLEELLAQAPAAIGFVSGPQHRWTYVNDEYVRLTGRNNRDDFIGKTLVESLPEMETQVFGELLDEVYRSGRAYFGREMKAVLNRSTKGLPEESYWDFVYQPVRDANGNVEGILVHAIEVTDKILARNAINETAERLQLAQSAAHIGTWEWDPVRNTRSLSSELHRLFGTEAADPNHAEKWAERVHHSDWAKVQECMMEGHRSGEMDFEYRYQHPDLGLRWFYCKGRRFRDETRMFGIVQDITARKIAEEARRRLAAIVESSDDAIISKDLNGIVTSWNRQAERLFGYTENEMIGRSILTIIPPELHRDEEMILNRIKSGEKIDHFETIRLAKSGGRIEVSLSISPVRDEHGNIVGAAKITRDIRENKKIERSLRTTEKLAAAGRLAATVAHEINNPLEAVTNLVYLAKRNLSPGNDKPAEYLSSASRELDRVAHIARQTLGFYRDTSSPIRFNIAQAFDDLLMLYERRLETRNIQIVREYDRSAELVALAGEIRQAISNLLTNSMDAMPSGGILRVRVRKTHEWNSPHTPGVRITIADSGIGIQPEHKRNLFQPFFTTKTDVGTGLGLWITRSIIEKHGGSIRLKSKAGSTHGTAISILLPIQSRTAPEGLQPELAREEIAGASKK